MVPAVEPQAHERMPRAHGGVKHLPHAGPHATRLDSLVGRPLPCRHDALLLMKYLLVISRKPAVFGRC
jgi:hypothetical protein